MRTDRRIAVTLAAAVLAGGAGAGVAQAGPAAGRGSDAPSACRPANHTATITEADNTAGHRHYRVTLTAPRGYEPCELAGSPTGLRFSHDGTDSGITAGRYGSQQTAVAFGPGRPVHFDIQVPSGGPGALADEAAFTLRAPDGEIPGTSYAEGALTVAAGTLVGPVRSGA
ncbi:DUF4232 domain-containing protein [Streptomyces sp. NBC_01477]|uniref:DUF4232 domain-containing protein n=1 Tax=Streptomyces sp. NBC_01477 TaxID=2976015 RepID=UPI002E30AD2D|nr:DUF4232 domain-containing protein [Streptomyces sp. NBC_01477]